MPRRRSSAALIGRELELATLRETVTSPGSTMLLLVSGEAGVGKSRLVREFTTEVVDRGVRVLIGECLEVGGATIPYAPFLQAMRHLAAGGLAGVKAEPAREVLRAFRPAVDAPLPDTHARYELFSTVLDVLAAVGSSRRALLVLEDLHWADAATLGLVEYLVRNGAPERLFIVGTYRTAGSGHDGMFHKLMPELLRAGRLERLMLEPFDEAGTRSLVQHLRTGADEAFAARIHVRAQGNPFFVEALLAADDPLSPAMPADLHEILRAQIRQLPPTLLGTAQAVALAEQPLPVSILAAVTQLIPKDLEEVVAGPRAADVLTRSDDGSLVLRHALLGEALRLEIPESQQRSLHRSLAEAMERDAAQAEAYAPARAKHWEAAGDTSRALAAHLEAAAQALRSVAPDPAADHYDRALALWPSDAVDEPAGLDRASVLELAAHSHAQAGHLRRALVLVDQAIAALPESSSRTQRVRLAYRRLQFQNLAGDAEASHGAVMDLGRELVGDGPLDLDGGFVIADVALSHLMMGQSRQAAETALRALDVAQAEGDERLEAEARTVLGQAFLDLHRVEEAATHLARLWDLARVPDALMGPRPGGAFPDTGHALGNVICLLHDAGHLRQALQLADTAGPRLESAPHLTQTRYTAVIETHAAIALFRLGRWGEASRRIQRGLQQRDALVMYMLHAAHAHLLAASGRFQPAARAVDAARRSSPHPMEPRMRVFIEEASSALALWEGRIDVLRASVAAGLAATEGLPNREALSLPLHALRLRGEADAPSEGRRSKRGSSPDRARRLRELAVQEAAEAVDVLGVLQLWLPLHALRLQCVAELGRVTGTPDAGAWAGAAEAWFESEQPYDAAYCLWRQAESLLDTEQAEQAAIQALLVQAHDLCRRLGARPLQRLVERSAARAGLGMARSGQGGMERRRADGGKLSMLSGRELEVLRLIAAGMTNRQIATQLLISEKTAAIHVSNILRKLDVEGRGEAAAIAHRHRLAGAEVAAAVK